MVCLCCIFCNVTKCTIHSLSPITNILIDMTDNRLSNEKPLAWLPFHLVPSPTVFKLGKYSLYLLFFSRGSHRELQLIPNPHCRELPLRGSLPRSEVRLQALREILQVPEQPEKALEVRMRGRGAVPVPCVPPSKQTQKQPSEAHHISTLVLCVDLSKP